MKEQNIAKVYAQSFLELGSENGFDVADELTKLNEAINASNDLENVLFLDVFTAEEKLSVFKAIAEKLGTNKVLQVAINFLIEEKRIGLLPLVYKEIIVIDDHKKGFMRGVIEGSTDSISDEYKNKLTAVIKEKIGKDPVLEYKKSDEVTAGYKVTIEDLQLDASIDNQLYEFKKSILGEHI
jgi:F-type H+-transporting ATPase subunit delta